MGNMMKFTERDEIIFYARKADSAYHDVAGWAMVNCPSLHDVVWC
jgi:hypothetical protein